jgi:type IV pilus assembly protein PilW
MNTCNPIPMSPKPLVLGHQHRRLSRGLTLIETMVALVIGMVLTLAVFSVMSAAESSRRTMTSMNDTGQAGNIAMFVLDEWIRSSGSGFAQVNAAAISDGSKINFAYGCPIYAAKDDAQILPRSSALPAPFDGTAANPGSQIFRLAPVLIMPGATTPGAGRTSDALVLMAGTSGSSETSVDLSGVATTSTLPVTNTEGFGVGDIVLAVDHQPAANGSRLPCWIEQVGTVTTATSLGLSGKWYKSGINSANLTDLSDQSVVLNLGNVVTNGNPPRMLMVGVGSNDALYSYDLLNTVETSLQQVAEGVFELHALYGIDTNGDNVVDSWVQPTGNYAVSALMAGTDLAASRIRTIKSIRLGLILRSRLTERDTVHGTTVSLFSDLSGMTFTRTLGDAERKFRYRTLESTIPLRNSLMAQAGL